MIMSKYCKFADINNEIKKNPNFIHNEDKTNKKIGFNMTTCEFRKGKAVIEFDGFNVSTRLKFNFNKYGESIYNNEALSIFPTLNENIKNYFEERYINLKDKIFDSPIEVVANEFNGEVIDGILVISFESGKLYIPEISYYANMDYGYYGINETKIYIIFNNKEVSFMDIAKSKQFVEKVEFFTHKICEV